MVASKECKTLVAVLELRCFYTKCNIAMKIKSKIFKKIASCSLESNKIKLIKATTTVMG